MFTADHLRRPFATPGSVRGAPAGPPGVAPEGFAVGAERSRGGQDPEREGLRAPDHRRPKEIPSRRPGDPAPNGLVRNAGYGRAPAGERVHGSAPGHGDTVTLICGLRLSGVTAPVVVPGATDTAVFESYVEEVLVPQLQAGDVVIWDNLKPHKANAVVSAVEDAGAQLIPLPPWSSDMTPIEEMFSKVKGSLRSVAARTTETVTAAIGSALHDISAQDILGWFQSRAAYAMQS